MTKVHANIRIVRPGGEGSNYYWTVRVLGVDCSALSTYYKTAGGAQRAAIRWCNRLGLTYTVTVDKGIRT